MISPEMSSLPDTPLTIGLVGTYPPTKCGIATFSASLGSALAATGAAESIDVVSCVERPGAVEHPPEVVAELVSGSRRSLAAAAAQLEDVDVVVLQHEFGIYGGKDGAEVLDLVSHLPVPVIVVLHTVLRTPSRAQRTIIERLAEAADRLVVPSAAARDRLLDGYAVEPWNVHLIQHGAQPNLSPTAKQRDPRRPPLVLTWGLLGPGKGIELGIEAISRLGDLSPAPHYLVLGQTHPKVVETQGERYRESLTTLARDLGAADRILFEDGYGDPDTILARAREADVVLLPYRSRDQVVSGVLVEAISSGTPGSRPGFPTPRRCSPEAPGS
jgi:polysaccharide biosynthesis protein PslF